ncbi:chondroitinase-B domain-containing protein [Pedobacter sp. SL55]|uniref:chondroitinase-B domain-containing protein n=1 Tax=Pedobacter sp. SL55 TaxID=2995161 RepID=UPI002271AB21|nr:chondroitinase-B domain-containing protein [Pedobacter sp. SL55]WAC40541.1 coagulation factor 5/8 type domain-containing protein [Pedobacter sp. SL55]
MQKIFNIYLVMVAIAISALTEVGYAIRPFLSAKPITVANSSQLKRALATAKPGDSIILKDGVYEGKFVIEASASGTKNEPIVLTGGRNAILDAGSIETGYVLSLKANYWKLKGFTVKNGLKGIVADGANYNVIDGVFVTQLGEEGIHFRTFSKHNTVKNSEVTHTGKKRPGYGEAIYIGSAYSNWAKYTNGAPDKCDSNQVLNNKLGPFVTAECIDVKEGTTGGIIKGNTFEAQGITGENSADSWMDIKGNYYLIANNIGYNTQPSVLLDGYQVNCAYEGWGAYNIFKNNISNVNAEGYGINIKLKSSKGEAVGNEVYIDNKVLNAAKGITNIELTKK